MPASSERSHFVDTLAESWIGACHPEHFHFAQCKLREGSRHAEGQILHSVQNDIPQGSVFAHSARAGIHVPGGRRPRCFSLLLPVLLLLPFLLAPAAATGQTWSEPQQPANLSPVQIQWRMYGVDTRTQKNIFEWIFSNAADTAVEFNYRIETNRGETRIGRISIKPRRKQLSGWLFSGDSLVSIKVARSAFGGKE